MSLVRASLWHVDQFYLLTSPDLGCFVGNSNFCSIQIKPVPLFFFLFFFLVIKDKSEIRSCLKMINSWQGRTASGLESADRSAPAEPAAESCHPQKEEPWQGTVLRRSGSSLESWEPCSAKEGRPEAPQLNRRLRCSASEPLRLSVHLSVCLQPLLHTLSSNISRVYQGGLDVWTTNSDFFFLHSDFNLPALLISGPDKLGWLSGEIFLVSTALISCIANVQADPIKKKKKKKILILEYIKALPNICRISPSASIQLVHRLPHA